MRVAVALLVLTAASVALRTGALDAGYWIDEAIAVGIASHDLGEIPALLRQDGSPPLYYLLLHGWMALVGDGEAATRALSLLFAAVAVPAAWWAAGGRRAGAVAAAVVAICPFLTYYAQEARMYTLVAVLSLVATAAFVRRRPVVLVAALTLLLYTHTWGVFLFAAFALVWLVRDRGRGGLYVGAAVAVLYLPWVPSLVFQALHTGAPWSHAPSVLYLVPAALAVALRPRDEFVLVAAAGLGAGLAGLAARARMVASVPVRAVRSGAGRTRAPSRMGRRHAGRAGRRLAARRPARRQEQRPRGRRQRRRHAPARRPRGLHAARAAPGPASLPPARGALPDAARHARRPLLHRLARRRSRACARRPRSGP